MLRHTLIACVAIVVAVEAVTTTVSTKSVFTLTHSTIVNCDSANCCRSQGCASYKQVTDLNRSAFPTTLPINISSDAGCSGLRCDCYNAWTGATIVDLTTAIVSVKRPKRSHLAIKCEATGGSFQSLSALQFAAQKGTSGGYFPAPYSANCSSSSSASSDCKWSSFTTVNTWDITAASTSGQTVHIPLDNVTSVNIDSIAGVLLGFNAQFNGEVDFCAYGGSGYGGVMCTVDIIGA